MIVLRSAFLCSWFFSPGAEWNKVFGDELEHRVQQGSLFARHASHATGSVPEIFNTDQGCQFTSAEWTGKLLDLGIKISMDGRGRWMDNVFIERLWRSVKYEEIYLFEHATVHALRAGLEKWFGRYNDWRPHQALGNKTPAMIYQPERRTAA